MSTTVSPLRVVMVTGSISAAKALLGMDGADAQRADAIRALKQVVRTGTDRGAIAIVFQVASALGTCGFQTTELSSWRGPLLLLLTIGMKGGVELAKVPFDGLLPQIVAVLAMGFLGPEAKLAEALGIADNILSGTRTSRLDLALQAQSTGVDAEGAVGDADPDREDE